MDTGTGNSSDVYYAYGDDQYPYEYYYYYYYDEENGNVEEPTGNQEPRTNYQYK